MSNIFNRITALLLVVVMMLCFAGCSQNTTDNSSEVEWEWVEEEVIVPGDSNEDASSNNSSNTSNSTTSNASSNNSSNTSNSTSSVVSSNNSASTSSDSGSTTTVNTEKRNLGGRTIKVLANWTEPIKGESDRNNRYWAKKTELQRKYNFTYEHIYMSDKSIYEAFIASILSGTPMADVVVCSNNPFPAIKQGLFYDLSKLKEFDFTETKWQKAVNEMGKVNDKQYLCLTQTFTPANLVFYNKDVFEQYGQEDLWDLQKAGKLTTNKFIEIATAISKKTGKPSMRGGITATDAFTSFAASVNAPAISRKANSLDFSVTVNTTERVNAFKRCQELITNGVLSDGLDSSSWTYSREQFIAGNVPIIVNVTNLYNNYAEPDFEVGTCVFPTDDGGMTTMLSDVSWSAIPYNTKNPQDVALIWNQISDYVIDVDYKGLYQDVAPDSALELMDKISKLQTTKAVAIDYSVVADADVSGVYNQMITGALSPAQALQTIEPLFTAGLKNSIG